MSAGSRLKRSFLSHRFGPGAYRDARYRVVLPSCLGLIGVLWSAGGRPQPDRSQPFLHPQPAGSQAGPPLGESLRFLPRNRDQVNWGIPGTVVFLRRPGSLPRPDAHPGGDPLSPDSIRRILEGLPSRALPIAPADPEAEAHGSEVERDPDPVDPE